MDEKKECVTLECLDKRYVKKDDIRDEIKDIGKDYFTTRTEHSELLGKLDSVQREQVKTTELLTKTYTTLVSMTEKQTLQSGKIATIEKDVQIAKEKMISRLWRELPIVIKIFITFIVVFIGLICITAIIGNKFNTFMSDNGAFVAILTFAFSVTTTLISENISKKKGGE